MDNQQLLQEYVEGQSEAAFAELVGRHVDLVYSTALRIVHDPAQAEDIAQLVFIKLARKAGSVRAETLPGWLYRVTHDHAANAIRSEEARRNRETAAMNLADSNPESSLAWNEIASSLDEAMQTLTDVEQNAVVLRFFQGQSWRDVSKALAASEDTAQRRVNSALEKLRAHFLKQGVTVSAPVLALAIGTNAVQAAPATLGTHLATGSLVAAGAKSTGIFSTFLKTLLAKWQITAAVVSGVAVVGVATTSVIVHQVDIANAEKLHHGLVLHLGFDEEEPDGRVSDDSGRFNHGQVTGARWIAHGRNGGAYEFNTDGDQIVVPDHPSLNPSNLTVSAWIKSPKMDGSWRFVVDKSVGPGYNLSIVGDQHADYATPGQAHAQMHRTSCLAGNHVADEQWHLLTCTYDGNRQQLFVDGQPGSILVHSKLAPSNNVDLVIGRQAYSTPKKQIGRSFRGLIDDVRVYDRALSPKEVSLLFASAGR